MNAFAPIVSQIANKLRADGLLLYGGSIEFLKELQIGHALGFQRYDIGNGVAVPMDLVVSVGELQEVGLLSIDTVLDDLKRVTQRVGFFQVTVPDIDYLETPKTIIQPDKWWLQKIMERFELQTFQVVPKGFYVIVYPKTDRIIH